MKRMNRKWNVFGILFLILIASCASSKKKKETAVTSTYEEPAVEDSLLVSLKRGACFGACPQFTYTVYKSGFAEYNGERNVKKTGKWVARLSKEEIVEIVGWIRQYRMEEKNNTYINEYLADFPGVWVTVSDKNPRLEIFVNHDQPPVEITGFISLVEGTISKQKWVSAYGGGQKDDQ
jgi:hypothetical protein